MNFVDFNGSWVFLYLFIFWWSYVHVLPKTVIGTEFDFELCGLLGRRDCPCQGLKQTCANCLVILKLFLHTDFHAKNETGKFISVIRMVRFTRLLICHTIKLKPSPSEFTAPCELLFSSVFIVIKTKTKTTNNVSSRLCIKVTGQLSILPDLMQQTYGFTKTY